MLVRRRDLLAGAAAIAAVPQSLSAQTKPRVTFISQWSSGSDGGRAGQEITPANEHLFLPWNLCIAGHFAAIAARHKRVQRRSAQNSWMRLQPSRRLSRSVA